MFAFFALCKNPNFLALNKFSVQENLVTFTRWYLIIFLRDFRTKTRILIYKIRGPFNKDLNISDQATTDEGVFDGSLYLQPDTSSFRLLCVFSSSAGVLQTKRIVPHCAAVVNSLHILWVLNLMPCHGYLHSRRYATT